MTSAVASMTMLGMHITGMPRGVAASRSTVLGQTAIGGDHLESRVGVAYFFRALAYTLLNMEANAQKDADKAVELGLDLTRLDMEIGRIKGGRISEIIVNGGICQS